MSFEQGQRQGQNRLLPWTMVWQPSLYGLTEVVVSSTWGPSQQQKCPLKVEVFSSLGCWCCCNTTISLGFLPECARPLCPRICCRVEGLPCHWICATLWISWLRENHQDFKPPPRNSHRLDCVLPLLSLFFVDAHVVPTTPHRKKLTALIHVWVSEGPPWKKRWVVETHVLHFWVPPVIFEVCDMCLGNNLRKNGYRNHPPKTTTTAWTKSFSPCFRGRLTLSGRWSTPSQCSFAHH